MSFKAVMVYRREDSMPLCSWASPGASQALGELNQVIAALGPDAPSRRCLTASAGHIFYLTTQGVTVMAYADASLHSTVVFSYLQEVQDSFSARYPQEQVRTASTYNSFSSYEPELRRLAEQAVSRGGLLKLQEETEEVRRQMMLNVQQLVERGLSLDAMERQTEDLVSATEEVFTVSKDIRNAAFWREYGVYAAIAGFVLLIILLKLIL